jgi:methylamine dehydrogenase heavy chain
VLDPQNGELISRIWVIDPQAQKVVRSFPARYTPNLAFSPDGRRLYVADGYYTQVIRGEWRDVLSVYDARSGELLREEVPISDRLMYKLLPHGKLYLFRSPDGRRLFVRKYGDPDVHRLRLTVLDAETFDVLAEYPACVNGDLWPLSDGRLLCVDGATVQFIEALSGEVTRTIYLPFREVASVVGPAGERLYLVSADARVTVVDVEAELPHLVGDPVSLDAPPGSKVAEGQIVLSPDGLRLYVRFLTGDWRAEGLNAADEIWAFDTRTWEKVGAFEPPVPAWNMALSVDGRQLYTVNPWEQTLSIFDTTTFREIGVMHDLGETPALIVVR